MSACVPEIGILRAAPSISFLAFQSNCALFCKA